jgi:hypothetical protein
MRNPIILIVLSVIKTTASCNNYIPNRLTSCDNYLERCEYSTCSDDFSTNTYRYKWTGICECRWTLFVQNGVVDILDSHPKLLWQCITSTCDCPAELPRNNTHCGITYSDVLYPFFRGDYRVAGRTGCEYQTNVSNEIKTLRCLCYPPDRVRNSDSDTGYTWQCHTKTD